MATRLVIVGLPGSGKTTVFNALTRADAKTGGFGAASDEPNLANVKVPDPRLDLLTEMFKPERKVQADVQYYDVAGIAKGIAEKGMSGALLNHLAQAEALIHVVRAFEDDDLPHPDGSIDPMRDIETINLEFAFSDLAIIEKRLQRLEAQIPKMRGAEKEAYEREQVVLTGLKDALEQDQPLRDVVPALDPDDRKLLSGFGLLSAKPLLILLNTGESQLGAPSDALVAEARERSGWQKLRLDRETPAVILDAKFMQLDFGGIAKGFAADEAMKILKQHGFARSLVAASGDIVVGDPPPDHDAWRIGIRSLDVVMANDPDKPLTGSVPLIQGAISTSGDTQQAVNIDGVRYSHIVDTKTALGLTHRIAVTVIGPDATTTDSYATTVSVLGKERGLAFIESKPGVECLILEADDAGTITETRSSRFPEIARGE